MPLLALLARPAVLLSLALALSMAANATLWKFWQHEVRANGAQAALTDSWAAASRSCSDSVEQLRRESEAARRRVEAELVAAAVQAKAAERRALATLQERPAVVGDACGSAAILSRRKLEERRAR